MNESQSSSWPSGMDMIHQLHEAVYGYTNARPDTPQQVWEELLDRVRQLAEGRCGECLRREGHPPYSPRSVLVVNPGTRRRIDEILAPSAVEEQP